MLCRIWTQDFDACFATTLSCELSSHRICIRSVAIGVLFLDFFAGILVLGSTTNSSKKVSTNVQDVELPSTDPQQNLTRDVVGQHSTRVSQGL